MSKAGKFLFLFSVLFFVGLCVFRIVYGGWHPSMWVPFCLTIVFFVFGFVKEFSAIMKFFTMRTTKHGLNMGVLILFVVVGLTCVNFLASRYEKSFDWTSEKLNSLSDQSIKAGKALKVDTELVLLYRNDQKNGENLQRNVRDIADMFMNVAPKLKYSAYNALLRPDLAQKYEFASGSFSLYAVQGEQKVKIDQPTEEGITRALLKFGRDHKKVIYFTAGHGERQIDGKTEDDLSNLKEDLQVTYEVKRLVLYETENKVPADADEVAIIGPHQQFLESELQAIRDYAKRGGHIFIAIDPGMKHNLAQLTKSLGVEFDNDYVLDLRSQVIRSGPATVLGTNFSKNSPITKAFESGSFAIFHLASSLKDDTDASQYIHVDNIIQTDPRTMNIGEVKDQVNYKANGPHILGIWAQGRLKGETDKTSPTEFTAVVFGDSDFLSNQLYHNNLNRDLALNSFSALANDADLISIRPKEPKGTKLQMTTQSFAIFLLGFLFPLPLLMFFAGGYAWWRRRAA